MNPGPDFDDIVGSDLGLEEREQLARVHDLLVVAGPPPELTPEVERGPTLAMTLGGRKRRVERRVALLAAAVVVIILAFLGGFVAGNGSDDGLASVRTLSLVGTSRAPGALASLRVQPRDQAGNWPMTLNATGLPKLPRDGYYAVFVTRNGKIFAPCGNFVVKSRSGGISVKLNAPYQLQPGDGWVVTKQMLGSRHAGPVVLKQLA